MNAVFRISPPKVLASRARRKILNMVFICLRARHFPHAARHKHRAFRNGGGARMCPGKASS